MSGFKPSQQWENFFAIIVLQFVGHPPGGCGIWFYPDCAPPTVSLWLLCLWTSFFWWVPESSCWWLFNSYDFGVLAADGCTSFYSAILNWKSSFPNFEPVCCSMSCFNCCFLTCLQVSRVRWSGIPISLRNFQFVVIHTVKGFSVVNEADVDVFLNSLAFSMIQQMLAVWALVSLCFLNPACISGNSWYMYCWSLGWKILSITLLACEWA